MFNLLSKHFKARYHKSYSQSGEDLILSYYLNKHEGFYVDIGTNDPEHLNNTLLFYKKGWNGINIEPNPFIFNKIKKLRKRDINLNLGVSNRAKNLPFYVFEPHTLSTFSTEQRDIYIEHYKLKDTKEVLCDTLRNILDNYAQNKEIDFLSVDVEGLDLNVLRSNNWKKHRPKFVLVETVQHKPIIKDVSAYKTLLSKNGYVYFADTFINSFFISKEYLNEIESTILN